ncbi:5-hydroxytryptamine receptor 3A-like [Engraulis encrasicolus]|uniref:5-hydroxytryptamine receptor 3A-like n=1 Tax=Engraulis encrasicolus TaxID=184585 RepID=UPI002FD104CD
MNSITPLTKKGLERRVWSLSIPVLLFIFTQSVVLQSAEGFNCSQPNSVSLLSALKENVLNLSDIRPVQDPNQPVIIQLTFILYGILGVDEKAQLLTTLLWLNIEFQNEFAHWDPEECGRHKISVPRKSLWYPDIVINEATEANTGPETYYVYLYSDGTVSDWLSMRVVSSCNMDIYAFPFDTQNCSYAFNSYLHTADDIQLVLDDPIEAILEMTNNVMERKGEWILVNMSAYQNNKNSSNEWNYIYVHLILKRHPTLYVVNLLVPSCFLISLDLFSFALPPQNVDRSAFKMTLILGYTVFLLLMNDLLPVTGNTSSNSTLVCTVMVSLLSSDVFFSICLALMVASLLETIIITNVLHNSHDYSDVPRWVRFLVIDLLARLVCLSRKTPDDKATLSEKSVEAPPQRPDVTETELVHQEPFGSLQRELRAIRQHMEKSAATQQVSEDWIHIAQVVDRFLFFIYLIFISTSFITILVMWTSQ